MLNLVMAIGMLFRLKREIKISQHNIQQYMSKLSHYHTGQEQPNKHFHNNKSNVKVDYLADQVTT